MRENKRPTSNVQRPTSNLGRSGPIDGRASKTLEGDGVRYGPEAEIIQGADCVVSEGQAFDLGERLLEFSIRVIRACRAVEDSMAGRHVMGQLIRSGTAPMAHHGEAEASRSRKDFVSKLGLALQELRETRRWIALAHRTPLVQKPALLLPLITECDELIKIFYASVRTARTNSTTP